MKHITLIIGLLVVGCGKQEQTTTEKPAKELTLREKVVGEYEIKKDGNTLKQVYLENGVFEGYRNGKKEDEEGKWVISKEGKLHILENDGDTGVFRINKDGSITYIAVILKDGKRLDLPKENQTTFKKIK